jgi:hypothetical protein
MNQKEYCVHKFEQVVDQLWGTSKDVCVKCGCRGRISKLPDAEGFYQIEAIPMATVTDLSTYRELKNRKGLTNVKR